MDRRNFIGGLISLPLIHYLPDLSNIILPNKIFSSGRLVAFEWEYDEPYITPPNTSSIRWVQFPLLDKLYLTFEYPDSYSYTDINHYKIYFKHCFEVFNWSKNLSERQLNLQQFIENYDNYMSTYNVGSGIVPKIYYDGFEFRLDYVQIYSKPDKLL